MQEVWGAFYGYALVIYCDFSAYTDIAIGIASLFGYRFPQNFDQVPFGPQSSNQHTHFKWIVSNH